MKSFLEEDKEVRYFPNDSEMPILIHYLQVYFSHPERSIQRSQVVQSVVSILSTKNKHWNHRTVRLWFNNNKRVFFRPSSPIPQSSNTKDSLQPRPEQQNPQNQVKQPLYIPSRPLSVVQLPSMPRSALPPSPVINKTPPIPAPAQQQQQMQQIPQMPKMGAMNMKLSIPMSNSMNSLNPQQQQQPQYQMHINQAYPRSPFLLQQPPPPPPPPNPIRQPPPSSPFLLAKPGSFALTMSSEMESITMAMLNNQQNIQQVQANVENNITEKISALHEKRWMQLATVQPCKTSIVDNNSIEIPNGTYNNTLPNASVNSIASSIDNQSNKNIDSSIPSLKNVANFDMIDCAVITTNTGEVAVISWDCETQCQRLYFRNNVRSLCETNAKNADENSTISPYIFSNAKAIAYSENSDIFWIHSGSFLRPISADDLSEGPSIKANLKYSERSVMTFWNEKLVLASGSSIMSWSSKNLDDILKGHEIESEVETKIEGDPEHDSEDHPLAESLANIDKSDNTTNNNNNDRDIYIENRDKKSEIIPCAWNLMIPSITSLTTVGENLVIASTEHHTAQVYAMNGALVAKCIGHTSGITCLHSFDANSFITGSSDQTSKYWDIRVPIPVFNLLRHRGIVTSVYGCGNINSNLIITGGTDGVVRGWDIRQLKHLFSFSVGQGSPMTIGLQPDGEILSVVTSERISESYYDLEKYGPKLSPSMKYLDVPSNVVLTYSMPK
ncbi:hypothetical protein M9Y10_016308 [Tritrichomonas musculus]|uniref:Uncharacterized protein n=1 Tax=Tritrichomonas musculus TaxID=1915356 RepID=A0ABR2HVV7_9EUKA